MTLSRIAEIAVWLELSRPGVEQLGVNVWAKDGETIFPVLGTNGNAMAHRVCIILVSKETGYTHRFEFGIHEFADRDTFTIHLERAITRLTGRFARRWPKRKRKARQR